MANLSITYNNFQDGAILTAAQLNTNFITDLQAYINNRNAGTTAWDVVKSAATLTAAATTNQLVLGTTTTLTVTSPAPASSRTYTIADAGANASFVLTEMGSSQTINSQLIFKGTATNDSAAAGYVGEVFRGVQSTYTNFPTSTQYGDGTSIALTAGDWDLSAIMVTNINGATWSLNELGISSTTGNSSSGLTGGDNHVFGAWANTATVITSMGLAIPSFRVQLTGNTTYYLKVSATYTAGTPQYKCRLSARRVR
jgi:hypothetical protein